MSFGAQPPFPDQATHCASGCRGPAGKLLELPHFSIVQMEPKYVVGFLKRVLRGDSCPNQQTVRVTQTGRWTGRKLAEVVSVRNDVGSALV